jgi:hypothetical protein
LQQPVNPHVFLRILNQLLVLFTALQQNSKLVASPIGSPGGVVTFHPVAGHQGEFGSSHTPTIGEYRLNKKDRWKDLF